MGFTEFTSTPVAWGLTPVDLAGIAVFFAFTFGYHAAYYVYAQRHPLSTVKGKIHLYRRTWIKRILDRGDYVLAIQALRNLIMASSFMASSSLLVIGIILNFTISGTYASVLVGGEKQALVEAKLYFLTAIFGFSFWQFLLNIRLLSQLTLLIGSDPDLIDHVEGVDAITYYSTLLNRATNRFTYGQRGFYFSLCVIAWIFSSWLFVALTFLIGLFLVGVLDFQRWTPPKALRREAEDLGHGSAFHAALPPAHHERADEPK